MGEKTNLQFPIKKLPPPKEKIVVGDNKEQILLKFKNSRLENYEKIAKGMYNEMQSLFFVPLEKSLNEIKSNLNQFEQNIKQIF